MPHRHEDATVWIGYADFLTTLTVLFFVIAVTLAGRVPTVRSGFVRGVVHDSITGSALEGCSVRVGERNQETNSEGTFAISVDSIPRETWVGTSAECAGYEIGTQVVTVVADDTVEVAFHLQPAQRTVWQPITLEGDALFDVLAHHLKPQGVRMVMDAGLKLKESLRPGEAIVVQGHTDDLPIPKRYGKDNWVLSGERAAAAANVLRDSVGIPLCQVAIMGFGPARPRPGQRVTQGGTETEAERAEKRARNRRIELHRVAGTDLIGGTCVP